MALRILKSSTDGSSRDPLTQCDVNAHCRWLKFEEDVEDGGDRWSKPYVATLSLHSLFEVRSCIIHGTVLLDMRADTLEEVASMQLFYTLKAPVLSPHSGKRIAIIMC